MEFIYIYIYIYIYIIKEKRKNNKLEITYIYLLDFKLNAILKITGDVLEIHAKKYIKTLTKLTTV